MAGRSVLIQCLLGTFSDRHGSGAIYACLRKLTEGGLCPSGCRLHPHIFRHSIAVHLLQRGADIRYIQQFLGHAHLDTTKVYLRLVPGQLREDYDEAMPRIEVFGLRHDCQGAKAECSLLIYP